MAWESKVCKRFHLTGLREMQKKGLEMVLSGKDVFISSKTGSGKSLIYHSLPELWAEPKTVLVVSPLVSIMEEQSASLTSCGYDTFILGRSTGDLKELLTNRKCQFVFGSPEMMVGEDRFREIWQHCGRLHVGQIVIDEAHTVLQWGGDAADETAFREWFRCLGELRSLLTDVPMLALTATASLIKRNKIMTRLCMTDALVLVDSPDRPNVKLSTERYPSSQCPPETFQWLLTQIEEKAASAPRTVAFCRSIADVSSIFALFERSLPNNLHVHFNMYHSMTLEHVKVDIRNVMAANGPLRVLIATNAAGMGFNFVNVTQVVHYGVPTDMDTYVQQLGRAGREDGSFGHSLILYSNRHIRTVDVEMLRYVKSEECRRELLCKSYEATKSEEIIPHLCCDICAIDCLCCEGTEDTCPVFLHDCVSLDSDTDSDMSLDQTRHVSSQEKAALFNKLHSLKDNFSVDEKNLILKMGTLYGLTDISITNIVSHCHSIFTTDDVLKHVLTGGVAKDILQIFQEVFMDVELGADDEELLE